MTGGTRNRGTGTPALAIFAMLGLSAPGPARSLPQVGEQWTTRPEIMSINPNHAGLLRTGEVLVIAGSGNDPRATVYKAAVWDPVAGTIAVQNLPWDVWCNGMSFLPDGRALITGGSTPYPTNDFKGLRNTTLFDPATSSFRRVEDMAHGRWYPTNVALPNGRTATFSGYDENGNPNKTFEIYAVGSGWSAARPMNWPATPPNYPRVHVTPAGDLFFSGSQRQSQRLDPQTLQWSYDVALTQYTATRRYGSSVLLALRPPDYPARILIAGGGVSGSATNSAEVIDVSRTPLQWNQTGALDFARVQHNAVLLPNGRVLAVGGSKTNNVADANGGGRFSEMYDPETGDWTVMDQQDNWRFYHSIALLLPDGSVASFGGNPRQGTYEQRIEIYHPPYLFTGSGAPATRPTVTGVPAQIGYAAPFGVTMPSPGAIDEAVLMRPGAPTHAFDMEQRMVALAIVSASGSVLSLEGPPNANIAPPGYYMLFLIDSTGVPSVAKFLRVSDSAAPPPPPPPPPSGNLLGNPGFESDATGWLGASGRVVTGTVHTGLKALQIKALRTGVVVVRRELAIEPGARYSAAVWVKTTDPYAAGAIVQTQFLNSAGTLVSTVNVGTVTGTQDWRQLQRNVTAPSTAAKVRFKLVGLKEPDGVATAYFDDASLDKL